MGWKKRMGDPPQVKWKSYHTCIYIRQVLCWAIYRSIPNSCKESESVSHWVMSDSMTPWTVAHLWPWNSPGKNTGVGSRPLLQGIFLTQGSNPGLLHCRKILYHLNYQGSPRILEWVAYPFSGGLLNPGIQLGSPALQVSSSPAEVPGVLFPSCYVALRGT